MSDLSEFDVMVSGDTEPVRIEAETVSINGAGVLEFQETVNTRATGLAPQLVRAFASGTWRQVERRREGDRPTQANRLSQRDLLNMVAFLGHVLEDHKAAVITKEQAIGGLAHVLSALSNGEHSEASRWFEQEQKLIRERGASGVVTENGSQRTLSRGQRLTDE